MTVGGCHPHDLPPDGALVVADEEGAWLPEVAHMDRSCLEQGVGLAEEDWCETVVRAGGTFRVEARHGGSVTRVGPA